MKENDLVNGSTCVLGIDPGLSGAVAKIGKGSFIVRRDFRRLPDIAAAISELSKGCDIAVIENVHAFPGQGVCSVWAFGKATGTAFGALFLALAKTAPLLEVAPLKWQNFFRSEMGVDKSAEFHSPSIATRLFPGFARPYLTRKLDHNTADAILLATWFLLQGPEARQQLLQPPVAAPKRRSRRPSACLEASPGPISCPGP